MRRVLVILLVASVVVVAAWYLAHLPGTVTAHVGNLTLEAAVSVVAVSLLLLLVVFGLLLVAVGVLIGLPHTIRARRAAARRRSGEAAATRALVALAAGEAADARREAARARRLLGPTPQALLLTAEAGRLSGRSDEAESAWHDLAVRPDAAFLGFRGLLRQAIERENWDQAAAFAREAEAAHPGAARLREERARLAVRTSNWAEALTLADADAPKAALATAAASAEPDPALAIRLARQAWKEDPALAPAALAYARRLRETGRDSRAQAVIRQTWEIAPQPELAAFALAPVEDKLARVQAAQRLTKGNPNHPESRLLMAETALEAGLLGEARRHAETARDGGLNQRRLWLLLARIEEEEHGDTEAGRLAQREALRHAAMAEADPVWYCDRCSATSPMWEPKCPRCGTAGTLHWGATPPPRLTLPVAATAPLSSDTTAFE
jgi:HemY protein